MAFRVLHPPRAAQRRGACGRDGLARALRQAERGGFVFPGHEAQHVCALHRGELQGRHSIAKCRQRQALDRRAPALVTVIILESPAARPRNRSYWTSGGLRKRSRWLGVESACKRLIPLVGVTGLEPATFWSRTKRSTKLSYTPRKRAGAVCGPRSLLDAGRAFNGIPDADRIACARVGAQGSARERPAGVERRPRDISPPGPRRGT